MMLSVRDPVPILQPRPLRLCWADNDEEKEALQSQFGHVPSSTTIAPDPRAMPAAEWRDKVRTT